MQRRANGKQSFARRATLLVLAIAALIPALAVAGCGGSDENGSDEAGQPAASAEQFAERFAELTGVKLKAASEGWGSDLEIPIKLDDDQRARFGDYSLLWIEDERFRAAMLGAAQPDAAGIHWEESAAGYTANKPYGDHLVLTWDAEARRTDPDWDRLERAVEAAYLGQPELLPEQERPCEEVGLDPLGDATGACAVDGVPVTFVDGDQALEAPGLTARVRGFEVANTIEGIAPQEAKGQYVTLSYSVENTTERPIEFLDVLLRVGERELEPDVAASLALGESELPPIAPGETLEAAHAFDVEDSLIENVPDSAALIVPAELDVDGYPGDAVELGWIRLAGAPDILPEASEPEQPAAPDPGAVPVPEGVPDVDFESGSGPLVGGTVRRLYTANTYFPLPEEFEPGGVNVGSSAGDCEVPAPTAQDRAQLLVAAREESPAGKIRPLVDRAILIAQCGEAGDWAMVAWFVDDRPGRPGLQINVGEFAHTDGRWVATGDDSPYPGCTIPEDAAAAWQIDVSVCDQPEVLEAYEDLLRSQKER